MTNEKLGTGAVTGKKIAKKAVSPRTLASNAVVTDAIANEAVTVGKLGKESVDASKISASLYAQLVRNVAYFSAESPSDSEEVKSVTAKCPSGNELKDVAIIGSAPFSEGNFRPGWSTFGHETGTGTTNNWSVEAFVVCAEL